MSEEKQKKTLDVVDDQRPTESDELVSEQVSEVDREGSVTRGNREVKAVMHIDGKRPIVANDFEVEKTLNVDGKRPITDEKNFEEASD